MIKDEIVTKLLENINICSYAVSELYVPTSGQEHSQEISPQMARHLAHFLECVLSIEIDNN